MFDTKEWLIAHEPEAHGITDDTWYVVGGLTLLWNLFEHRHCDDECDVSKLEAVVNGLQPVGALSGDLQNAWAYWTGRYVDQGKPSHHFVELFNRDTRRDWVSETLVNPTSSRDQLLAMLIIVYRLRNRLFHGLKGLPTLNEQQQNLDTASRVLAATMELLG